VNPLPPVVTALFLILFGIEVAFLLGAEGIIGGPTAVGWRLAALQAYAMSPEVVWWMLDTSRYPPEHLMRFVGYAFVHGTFTQALFSGVILLAMGKIVGEALGSARLALIYLASAIGAALIYSLVVPLGAPLIGAFPAVYGLIGGFTFLLWVKLGMVGGQQARAFSMIAVLMGVQLLFTVIFGTGPEWVADLAGFAVGFAMTALLIPGGWRLILARMRRR
ncbi:MAG: rhomboid family intramembrane serine protease, partial [Paracoccaceae bacterium]